MAKQCYKSIDNINKKIIAIGMTQFGAKMY
jgi:hypothetical protein